MDLLVLSHELHTLRKKTKKTTHFLLIIEAGSGQESRLLLGRWAALGTGSQPSSVDLGGGGRGGFLRWLVCAAGWTAVFSSIIPNPPTAAVNTMANPIRTRLCVEIKTHVGHEEASYYLELKGGEWVDGITRSPARLLLLKQAPTGFPPQQKVKKKNKRWFLNIYN